MAITTDSQRASVTKTTVQGQTIYESAPSTALASKTNKIVTNSINSTTLGIKGTSTTGGVSVLAGVDVQTAFSGSGTAGVSATSSFSLTTSKTTLESAQTTTPTITITSSLDGTVRTFSRDTTGEVASATFEFSEGAELDQTITLIASDPAGSLVSKRYKAAAVGTTNGSLDGSDILFAQWDATAASDADKKEDASANLAAAITSDNGHGDSTNGNLLLVFPNVVSETDSTADAGKITILQGTPGPAGNTNISKSATAASATFTFSDKPNETSTITLTDTDGTAFVFEIDNENNGVTGSNIAVNGIAAAGGGATGTAADLVAKINAQATLDITATNPSAGKVDLVQGATGAASNKTITVNDASHWNSVCSVNVPAAFTGGIAFDDHCSSNVPAAFTGGTATSRSYAAGQFNGAHSPRYAAYDLAKLINDVNNGVPGITAAATNNQIVCTNTATGTVGNSSKITYNSTWPNISSVNPRASFSGGVNEVLCNLGYEQSLDGLTWTDTVEVIADIKPNVAGLKLAQVEFPSAIAPYIRWVVNSNGADLGSTTGVVVVKQTSGT
tara:strand:+ start:127 stop:1806 length:1680 start_codon:yes stop_codon:yes gene_type:complete